jgi:uncharacterized membrane protein
VTKNLGPWLFASVVFICMTVIALVLIFRGDTSAARGVLAGTLGIAAYMGIMYGTYRLFKELIK